MESREVAMTESERKLNEAFEKWFDEHAKGYNNYAEAFCHVSQCEAAWQAAVEWMESRKCCKCFCGHDFKTHTGNIECEMGYSNTENIGVVTKDFYCKYWTPKE